MASNAFLTALGMLVDDLWSVESTSEQIKSLAESRGGKEVARDERGAEHSPAEVDETAATEVVPNHLRILRDAMLYVDLVILRIEKGQQL